MHFESHARDASQVRNTLSNKLLPQRDFEIFQSSFDTREVLPQTETDEFC